jgi:thiosulfate/3-mercaptopyruvate sulfurtransferase
MKGIPQFKMVAGHISRAGCFSIIVLVIWLISVDYSLANSVGLINSQALNRYPASWVVLDARPITEWQTGHIPGARSFSWENYTRTDGKGVPYKVCPPEELAKALGTMGINEKTPVVVYGDADKSWGGEGWAVWVLSWLGHKGPVMLLDGGIQAWRSANLPMKAGAEQYGSPPARYRQAHQPQLGVSTAELHKLLGSVTIIDTRSTWEWLRGRIPTAVHIPWEEFFSGRDRRPIKADELKKLLAKHGVDPRKPVVYYCAGGIRSAYAWMVHELAGLPPARNYEGGMEEWKQLGPRYSRLRSNHLKLFCRFHGSLHLGTEFPLPSFSTRPGCGSIHSLWKVAEYKTTQVFRLKAKGN